jgi:uncharacterized protein YdeI (YjbR/CyaY-like superfamily)
MTDQILSSGTLHDIPHDLYEAILSNAKVIELRNAPTPIARNEWICRVTIVKKDETRKNHIHRFCEEITQGKKRPCCRPGCPHHRENAKKPFL